MVKMLIVDDMIVTRDSILNMTDWNSHSIDIIGTASNGKEAIEYIEKNVPDIVITDLKMPVMDGLELSRKIFEKFGPQIKIIILSAYNEFEYARKAITYRVSEYLLKPIKKDELLKSVLNLRDEVEKLRLFDSSYIRKTESVRYLERERLIETYLDGNIDKAAFCENSVLLDPYETKKCFTALCVWINNYSFIQQKINFSQIKKAMEEFFDKNFYFFRINDEEITCIFAQDNNNNKSQVSMFEDLKKSLIEQLKNPVSLFIGNTVFDTADILETYNQAKTLLRRKLFYKYNSIYIYNDQDLQDKTDNRYPAEKIESIMFYIKLNEVQKLRQDFTTTIEYFKSIRDAEMLFTFLDDIQSEVQKNISELNLGKCKRQVLFHS